MTPAMLACRFPKEGLSLPSCLKWKTCSRILSGCNVTVFAFFFKGWLLSLSEHPHSCRPSGLLFPKAIIRLLVAPPGSTRVLDSPLPFACLRSFPFSHSLLSNHSANGGRLLRLALPAGQRLEILQVTPGIFLIMPHIVNQIGDDHGEPSKHGH